MSDEAVAKGAAKAAKKAKKEAEAGAATTPAKELKKKAKAKTPQSSDDVKPGGKKRTREEQEEENGGGGAAAAPASKAAKTAAKGSSKKKAGSDDEAPASPAPLTATTPASELGLDRFELSEQVKSMLRSQGIEALFPIQAMTLGHGLKGVDVVGRARTGCGKTLAFVLPIVERILMEQRTGGSSAGRGAGRLPSVIVLAPTRELAKQVRGA